MNSVEKNESLAVKILAIIGFSAAVLFIVWLLVVVAKGTPTGFASLAAIVGQKETYQENLVQSPEDTKIEFTSMDSVVNSGEVFTISWSTAPSEGTYVFYFECIENQKAEVRIAPAEGLEQTIVCGKRYGTPDDADDLNLIVHTTDQRFTEIIFYINLVDRENEVLKDASLPITVLNSDVAAATTLPQEVAGESTVATSDEDTPVTQYTPAQTPPRYGFPTSNQSGFADLRMTIQSASNNTLILDVTNIGTKISSTWSFIVSSSNYTIHNSPTELPLKPMEHAVFTIRTDTDTRIVATVITQGDSNPSNNTDIR